MSEKNRDDKNRWRNVTIAFRMSPEENEERAKLRRAYIDSVVGDLRQQLDNTYIVDAKGNKRKLRQ